MMMQSNCFPFSQMAATRSDPSNPVSTSKSPVRVRTRESSLVLTRSSSTTMTRSLGRAGAAEGAGGAASEAGAAEAARGEAAARGDTAAAGEAATAGEAAARGEAVGVVAAAGETAARGEAAGSTGWLVVAGFASGFGAGERAGSGAAAGAAGGGGDCAGCFGGGCCEAWGAACAEAAEGGRRGGDGDDDFGGVWLGGPSFMTKGAWLLMLLAVAHSCSFEAAASTLSRLGDGPAMTMGDTGRGSGDAPGCGACDWTTCFGASTCEIVCAARAACRVCAVCARCARTAAAIAPRCALIERSSSRSASACAALWATARDTPGWMRHDPHA